MSLQFHNQLTHRVDTFTPQIEGKVSLYTCGPTVYNYLHVGNWTAYIYWDTLIRVLQANGLRVERVMNITDVGHLVSDADEGEDKLEKGARREGKTAWDIASFYTDDFIKGMARLHLLTPQHIIKATSYITEQLELVRTLQKKGFTYQIDDGIYFDTSKFPSYGHFAGLDLDAQKAGARVEFNPQKKNPVDFALWKFTPQGETRDMEWETPIDLLEPIVADGLEYEQANKKMGFPGWHLECSAMAMTLLGKTLDIHTGGIDHIPVHHTNEIAQSEAATGVTFAHYWLHNNHLKVNGTKISKSLGNGYTLNGLGEKGYSPLDFRLFVLQRHYRSEGNFTFENLESAKNRLHNWRNSAALRHQTHDRLRDDDEKSTDDESVSLYASSQALIEAISNDLDTPAACAIIDEAFRKIDGINLEDIHQHALTSFIETVDNLLGLALFDTSKDISDDIKRLIIERERAREKKDWQAADRLRDQIEKSGVTVRDTAHGSIWEYVA
ncbi:MAG: cysteine--tRNA ligase [Candidatus Microsaccharimonas sossegonensis]|uniref:Cysteine--tRNA ligase n=1 Tax=Candidatus Microsaccharimonas sossegonensis TaxID=2506948 RepID=A0A4Q0AHU4_9BACT|nr:MAG: cysteine--tRNA ligase [Candidatus Microsaccharimonas sossegonensis]